MYVFFSFQLAKEYFEEMLSKHSTVFLEHIKYVHFYILKLYKC